MELKTVEMGDWLGVAVKEDIDGREQKLRVLRTLYGFGMSHSPNKNLNLDELWGEGQWDDDGFVEIVLQFARERYNRLARHNTTPDEAIKSAVNLLTCPFMISPERMKFGGLVAEFGEPITISLFMMQSFDVAGIIAKQPGKETVPGLVGHA